MSTTTKKTTINPSTGRPITVGGNTWRKLVHDKVIEGDIVKPLYEADTPEEAKVAKKLIVKQQPPKAGFVHKIDPTGKRVILARKKLSNKQLTDYMLSCTTKVMQSEHDAIDPTMTEAEINDILAERVLKMMLTDGQVTKKQLSKFAISSVPDEPDESAESDESETDVEESE